MFRVCRLPSNSQKRSKNSAVVITGNKGWVGRQKGFTIVEILVVVAILGIISYMMSDIVSRSLQGNQKTAIISITKQNGQVVLDSISAVVRNSDQVVCVGTATPNPIGQTAGDVITLYAQNGRYVRFIYPAIGVINAAIGEDFPQINILINNDPSIPASMQANICNLGIYPLNNQQVLTDTDQTNGVLIKKSVDNSNNPINIFTVTKRPGSSDSVSIQFDVKPSGVGGGFQNQLGGTGLLSFQQTVQLR